MRDHVLDHLARLANALLECNDQIERGIYARHAWRMAQHFTHLVPPPEGSP